MPAAFIRASNAGKFSTRSERADAPGSCTRGSCFVRAMLLNSQKNHTLVEPGGLVVADNVLSHPDPLADYSAARQGDSTLLSVTVPLDRGLELSVVLQ